MTSLLLPSKALTTKVLRRKCTRSPDNLSNVAFGMTFKDESLSISTHDMKWSIHLTDIWRTLLWPLPFEGISSLVNIRKLLVMMWLTILSNLSIEIFCFIGLRLKLLSVTLDGKWNASIISTKKFSPLCNSIDKPLYTRFVGQNFKNSQASSSLISFFYLFPRSPDQFARFFPSRMSLLFLQLPLL